MPKLYVSLPGEEYLTVAGVQEKTGLSRNTVVKLIAGRKLEARDFCGLMIIPEKSFLDYLKNLPPARISLPLSERRRGGRRRTKAAA